MKLKEITSESTQSTIKELEKARAALGHVQAGEERQEYSDEEAGEIDQVLEAQEDDVVQSVNLIFANVSILHHSWHKIHWRAFGHSFYEFHKMAAKFLNTLHDHMDQLAEQVIMLEGEPPYAPSEQEGMANIEMVGSGSMREMFAEVEAATASTMEEAITAAREAEAANDLRTMDLLIKISATLAKQRWWVEASLKKGDGFHR